MKFMKDTGNNIGRRCDIPGSANRQWTVTRAMGTNYPTHYLLRHDSGRFVVVCNRALGNLY